MARSKSKYMERRADNRVLASAILTWANLVFIGLVISQAFSNHFVPIIAFVGMGFFIAGYLIAFSILRGGEKK